MSGQNPLKIKVNLNYRDPKIPDDDDDYEFADVIDDSIRPDASELQSLCQFHSKQNGYELDNVDLICGNVTVNFPFDQTMNLHDYESQLSYLMLCLVCPSTWNRPGEF